MDAARLARIPLFTGLTLDQRDVVAGACTEVEVDEGATLLKEGDFGYAMFAITGGTADVLQDGAAVRALGPGDVFGEIAVLSGGPRTATVVARAPMQLVTVLNRDVWRLEREAPAVGALLRSRIAEHLEPTTSSLQRLDLDLEQRVDKPLCTHGERGKARAAQLLELG